MTPLRTAALLAAALVLAGCGVAAAPGSSTGTGSAAGTSRAGDDAASRTPAVTGGGTAHGSPLPERLDGRRFTTTSTADVTGFALVPGSALTLTFGPDRDGVPIFGGSAGCNQMGGSAIWDGNTVRTGDDFASTAMACTGLMEQEAWYLALLQAGITVRDDGDRLTVTDAGGASDTLGYRHVTISMTEVAAPGSGGTGSRTGSSTSVTSTGSSAGASAETGSTEASTSVANSSATLLATDNPLLGRTFELTRTFTDDGGADRRLAGARLLLTFRTDSVIAAGSCGAFDYPRVRYLAESTHPGVLASVDLGKPDAEGCVIGDDPVGPPAGVLMTGVTGDEMWLSTGFVAWYFRPVS